MIAEELDRIEAEQQEQLNSMVEAYERDSVMTGWRDLWARAQIQRIQYQL